ncbi:MAG: acetyl-CoA carboxylase biotin carboxylase subunit [Ktedonobacteraceae bacterium]
MFKKILIANRGEIAVRIMMTCREMGIRSVAVYSDVDARARHVLEADEAYTIGPAPATQSYLNIAAIIDAARKSGAEAIHPGYGFLSENAAFVEACEAAGLVFIGPPASAMHLMGSKIAAKRLAQEVGAPTVPGYSGDSQDDAVLAHEAQRVGFPLLIKASAGGGGKGMRVVNAASDFLEQLAGARREALTAFGDATVFLERFIQQPRHIEIQVLGDTHGNLLYLGERECSIQRRHQKILEESPSVALTPGQRAAMGEAAVSIARAAHYVNAGTLEFMLDAERQFYFLEMNTRLQVEHPVTELVTGLDLVRQQIRIAAGEPLPFTQEQITQRGHAIEVRIYAEDAAQNFLPSTGTITTFVKPEGPGIRLDSGVTSGDEVTQYYDPMLAKLIVYGEDRPAAIQRLQHALEQTAISGVTTNIALLHAISTHPAFRDGQTYTNFLTTHSLPHLEAEQDLPDDALIAAALTTLRSEFNSQNIQAPHSPSSQFYRQGDANPWQLLGPWRMIGGALTLTYTCHKQAYKVALQRGSDRADSWSIFINGRSAGDITGIFNTQSTNGPLLLRRGTLQTRAFVDRPDDATIQVSIASHIYTLQRQRPPTVDASVHGSEITQTQKALTAPMAGTLVKVQVRAGDIVEAHQVLLILSAMKMEHSITAPYAGRIQRVLYPEGAVVRGGAVVIEME